jgi:hypothetical protein
LEDSNLGKAVITPIKHIPANWASVYRWAGDAIEEGHLLLIDMTVVRALTLVALLFDDESAFSGRSATPDREMYSTVEVVDYRIHTLLHPRKSELE